MGEVDAGLRGDGFEPGAALDDIDAFGVADDVRVLGLVMLVLDVADDRLDDVLDRHQPVGAAVFVDDERHMRARRLHLHQKIERRHGRRHENHRAQDIRRRERERQIKPADALRADARARQRRLGGGGEMVEEIADVDHAARIIERVAVHGQARVAGGAEDAQHLAQRRVDIDRDDIGARQHHVLDPELVQAEHVFQHDAFLRREIARRGIGRERLVELLARRRAAHAERGAQPLEQAGARRPRRLGVGTCSAVGGVFGRFAHARASGCAP